MGGEGVIFVRWRSTKKGFHIIAPPRLWVVSQFEILATPITGRTGTGSVSDCGVIRPAPGSSASEMATWGSFGATSAGRDTDRWRISRGYHRAEGALGGTYPGVGVLVQRPEGRRSGLAGFWSPVWRRACELYPVGYN